MSLRARLALLAAVAVAVAVVVVSLVAFRSSRAQQREALDERLLVQAEEAAGRAGLVVDLGRAFGPRSPAILAPEGLAQVIDAEGEALTPSGQVALPIDDVDLAVALGRGPAFRDIEVEGASFRMVTVTIESPVARFGPRGVPRPGGDPAGAGDLALQLATSLEPVEDSLNGLRVTLLVVTVLGVVGAGLAGLAISRRALRPVRDVTEAAEEVARTQALSASIPVSRRDEIGRLAESVNAMLAALGESRAQQQQLVTDAGHELRTPLTALRTNVELLQRAGDLPADERARVVDDAVHELEELSVLVGELVDLATDARTGRAQWQEVDLAETVEGVAARYRRRRPGAVTVAAAPGARPVTGDPSLLDRAVANLVDNAVKWTDPQEPVAVTVGHEPSPGGDAVTVRVQDRGPGIPTELRERVFDRFYRAPGAQDRPGSGLGLAIVRQIVDAHGGTVLVEDPPDGPGEAGGVVVGFTVPVSTRSPSHDEEP